MNAYTTFAQVYDLFMDNVPYEEWSNYIVSVLKEYGIHSGVICDLGCGTGKMTRLLAKAGYDMIGVDLSEDMLAIASGQNEDVYKRQPSFCSLAGKDVCDLTNIHCVIVIQICLGIPFLINVHVNKHIFGDRNGCHFFTDKCKISFINKRNIIVIIQI